MGIPQMTSGQPGHRVTWLVVLLLAGLPIAVWLDLRTLAQESLTRQAADINSLINSFRGYYASQIVAPVLAGPSPTQVSHNYQSIPGAIPIPATLSLELGQVISQQQANIGYRFISDYPFANRRPHRLDTFESDSLAALRLKPDQVLTKVNSSLLDTSVRFITPVIMGEACVACHNSHPESPKRDWKVGDVRGIQETTLSQPIATNIFVFKYLLIYMVIAASTGVAFILSQQRQARVISDMNGELERNNAFLSAISMKISRYLAPQIYKTIFSGELDATIHTERKKLTIFFSDIKNFTETTERLQPEQITNLLNEYFSEMSLIAHQYGGTIDKFIGDAILIFFGDPETKGAEEDAKACLRMAVAMQDRLLQLSIKWRSQGIEHPFQVRMGINTGFCNVGNFGSNERMDYTIIGAEANLAARLQSIAEPGAIVVSYETYALVREVVAAHPLPPIMMKGISHEVIPYVIERMHGDDAGSASVFIERGDGIDLYLNTEKLDSAGKESARKLLKSALAALDKSG